ncbi:MAG: tol-pal system protein YbgF [Acidobacteriota bacterium]
MRQLLCAILAVAMMACGSTAPADEPAPKAAPAPPPTDPRISEMQVLVSELLDRIEVMNARLARLEAGSSPAPVQAPQTTQTQPPARTVPPAIARPKPAAVAVAVATPLPVPAHNAVVTAAGVSDAYRQALTLFGKGQINDSRALFQKIFEADPSGELADNALYWVGETWFVTGNYPEAIRVYQRVEHEYGEQNKAPDAVLKIGMAQARTGDLMLARKTFEHLIARYPYSTAAAAARGELTRIKY